MGDDDFARLAHGHGMACGVQQFHHHVFGRQVHAAAGAFMRDETGVAPAVAVGHRAAEHGADGGALVVVQPFAGDERDADAQVVQTLPALLRVARDVAERAGVAEQHARARAADGGHHRVELGLGHLERGQQLGAHQLVA